MALTIPAFQLQSLNIAAQQISELELTVLAKDATGANVDLTAGSGDGPWECTLVCINQIQDQNQGTVEITGTNHNGSISFKNAMTGVGVGNYDATVYAVGSDGLNHVVAKGTMRVAFGTGPS